jgi:uncharacterized membrane protein
MNRETVRWIVYVFLGIVALSIAIELLPFVLIGGLIYYGYLRYNKRGTR